MRTLKFITSSYRFILTTVLLSIFLLPMPQHAEAQIWKNLGRKIEKKVEDQASRRLERKIDKAIDKGFDEAESAADNAVKAGNSKDNSESSASTANQSKSQANASSVSGGGNTSVEDSYKFNLGVEYELQSNGNSDKINMTMWFSKNGYVGMDASTGNGSMTTVIDTDNMIVFMEDQKSYMVMSNSMLGAISKAAVKEAEKSDPTKVKMTRLADEKILGYNCQVYQITSEDGESKIWITTELDANPLGITEGMKNFGGGVQIPAQVKDMNGAMMKVESRNTKDKEQVVMQAIKVHKDGKTINSKEYKNMSVF